MGRAENREEEIKWHIATWHGNSVVMDSQEFFAVFNETRIRINLTMESNTFAAAFIFHIWLKSGN